MTVDFKKEWIEKGFTSDVNQFLNEKAQSIPNISKSSIRNIFNTIKKIQMKLTSTGNETPVRSNDILLLRPRFSYTLKRIEKKYSNEIKILEEVTFKALEVVENRISTPEEVKSAEFRNVFNRFCDYYEALLAYHKQFAKN
ncbi:MAG: type III-A CRISPR-associated protein Csm2 [SAR324 cluster bacterium]|nr:type III-A CRISPR-associated protein Csm2 [SAR324 cluster bacterium]